MQPCASLFGHECVMVDQEGIEPSSLICETRNLPIRRQAHDAAVLTGIEPA